VVFRFYGAQLSWMPLVWGFLGVLVWYGIPLSVSPPPPGVSRCNTPKILGVTATNSLSTAEHIHIVIKSSSQTLHALRILHLHGMSATVIQHVLQAVVNAKITDASQSWSGFTSAADIQCLNAFLCQRSPRLLSPGVLVWDGYGDYNDWHLFIVQCSLTVNCPIAL